MKNRDWLILLMIVLGYIFLLLFFKKEIFQFRFDESLIKKYFCSQDIPKEPPCKRLFLSDEDIYLSTGYLYAKGADPSLFNFEHPPLIKYLFGYSILLFSNPYFAQIFLGILFLIVFYYLALKIYKSRKVAILSSIFILIDPLFLDISIRPLLDLGQTLFMLLYFLSVFFWKEKFILQGLFLALFAGTKFWITPLFFVFFFYGYKIYVKKINWKIFIFHLIAAFIFYSLLYTQTFKLNQGKFNIVWHILKTFKYRIDHNTSSFFGASIILFLSGFLESWWGKREIIRSYPWHPLWPFTFAFTLLFSLRSLISKKINLKILLSIIPIAYLFYLGVQAPFPRYFFIILPFLYLSFANFILSKFNQ